MATGTELLFASAAGLSIASTVHRAQATAAAARFSASLAAQQAARRREIGALQEAEFRRQTARLVSGRRARLAKAGVRPDEGSPLLAVADTAADRAFALSLLHADTEAAARGLTARSASSRLRATSARQTGLLNLGQTLLSRGSRFEVKDGQIRLIP